MGEEEKNYIIRQADMYISGKSLREIAEIIGKSHITVRNNLTKKLRYADAIKYKIVMEKLEYNKEKSIEDEEVRTRILDAYELLVLKNKTVSEIAADLGTTDNIIYRDLSERLQELNKVAPDIITNDMVKKVAETLRNHSIRNNPYLVFKQEREKQTKMKNRLNKMFHRKDRQINFLTNCALTYGLRVETIADFFGDNPTDLLRDFQSGNSLYNNLSNVFKHGMKPQQEAVAEFENFFERLTKASINKDKEKITEILEEISDKKALKIANRDKTKQLTLTDDEILTILKFQIKYMISTHQIERIFGISKSNYKKRVKRLQTEHEKLVSDFEYIADFVSCIPNKVTERR